MNKQETIQVITLLAGNYNEIANKTSQQKSIMIDTWYECLKDLEYNIVLKAVKKTIIESPYPPTIHDIRSNVVSLNNIQNNTKTPIEAWDEAYQMIRNGIYMTREEFEKHTPEVQKFFGSLTQLKAYATNENFNLDVVRSNFLKQYDILAKNNEQQALLPNDIKQFISAISSNVKQIE